MEYKQNDIAERMLQQQVVLIIALTLMEIFYHTVAGLILHLWHVKEVLCS